MYVKFQFIILLLGLAACKSSEKGISQEPVSSVSTNEHLEGPQLEIVFNKGEQHNHPLMAVWIEDTSGNFLQTLYVAESIGKGVFRHGDPSGGKWKPGAIRRPAALPVWSHKRGIKAEDGLFLPSEKHPVSDAVTGATPPGSFIVTTRLDAGTPDDFWIFFEINQTWDFNEYWTNNKYPDNEEYKTSCQPALVYGTKVHLTDSLDQYQLQLLGHAHYAGENGNVYTDVSTFTTALQITDSIMVRLH